jgi:hypothetical protein
MMRRLFVVAILGLTLSLAGHPSVRSADKTADAKQPNFVHTVIFFLKKDAPKEESKVLIADALELLTKVPTVKGIRAGVPAENGTSAKEKDPQIVAPKDFQVGLVVLFEDADGLASYHKHPLHDKFVERHGKHIEKVIVYDFLQASK